MLESQSLDTDLGCSGWDNSECTGSPYCPPRCPRFIDKSGAPILIRPFEEADNEVLVGFYMGFSDDDRAMGLPPKSEPDIEAWLDLLTCHGLNLLAINHNDAIIGHITALPKREGDQFPRLTSSAHEVEIVIFVSADYRNRGVGSELVKQLIAYTGETGVSLAYLFVSRSNSGAIAAYQNAEFGIAERHPMTLKMGLELNETIVQRMQRPPKMRDVPVRSG